MTIRIKRTRFLAAAAVLCALLVRFGLATPAAASDQAKAIVDSIDPKLMNELVEAARKSSDISLANIVPIRGNKFRFMFLWPSSYPRMPQDRIGQTFVQRFLLLADQQKLLANGYCLLSEGISFGTATYAEQELNVAYRDIEVKYLFSDNHPCLGHYIPASDFFKDLRPSSPPVEKHSMLNRQRQK